MKNYIYKIIPLLTLFLLISQSFSNEIISKRTVRTKKGLTFEAEFELEVPAERTDEKKTNAATLSSEFAPAYNIAKNHLILLEIEFERDYYMEKRDEDRDDPNETHLKGFEFRSLNFFKTDHFRYTLELGVGLPYQNYKWGINPSFKVSTSNEFLRLRPFIKTMYRRNYYRSAKKRKSRQRNENQLGTYLLLTNKIKMDFTTSLIYRWNQAEERTIQYCLEESISYKFSKAVKFELGHEHCLDKRSKDQPETPFQIYSDKGSAYFAILNIRP